MSSENGRVARGNVLLSGEYVSWLPTWLDGSQGGCTNLVVEATGARSSTLLDGDHCRNLPPYHPALQQPALRLNLGQLRHGSA